MRTSEMFKNKILLSFEVFPPKRTASMQTIYDTLDGLKQLKPDFISVTYGAGGSDNSKATLEIASAIKHQYGIESVAHLSCIGHTKEGILTQLKELEKAGIENILALRGDIPEGSNAGGDFLYASDMITFMKEHGNFNILAACYPEGHVESESISADIENLKIKVDAGAEHLITQLFFDNDYFYRFRERCAKMGICVPIEAGIMPAANKAQIERMVSLCGASLPHKFIAMMSRYEDNPQAMLEAGIDYAIGQITDLISQGAAGIHLYTMNNPYIAGRIYEAVHGLIN